MYLIFASLFEMLIITSLGVHLLFDSTNEQKECRYKNVFNCNSKFLRSSDNCLMCEDSMFLYNHHCCTAYIVFHHIIYFPSVHPYRITKSIFRNHVVKTITWSSAVLGFSKIQSTFFFLHGLSPQANYTDRAAAAGRRSQCQLLWIEGCHVVSTTDPHGR